MKKLGFLLVLMAAGMFALGCAPEKKDKAPVGEEVSVEEVDVEEGAPAEGGEAAEGEKKEE